MTASDTHPPSDPPPGPQPPKAGETGGNPPAASHAGKPEPPAAPPAAATPGGRLVRYLRPLVTLALFLGLVAAVVLAPDDAHSIAEAAKRSLTLAGHGLFLLPGTAAIVVAIGLIVSPMGARRLGPAPARPLGGLSWFCLAFGAGTLSGLLVWAAAEPLYHLLGNPLLAKGEAESPAATAPALRLTNFHWALHPWAVFALAGAAMAWGAARHRLPIRPSSALAPFFGGPPPRWIGVPVDIAVVLIALLAAAVVLGLGVLQADTALAQLTGFEPASVKAALAEKNARAAARLSGVDAADLAAFLRARRPDGAGLLIGLGGFVVLALMVTLSGLRRALRLLAWLAVGGTALFVVALLVFGPTLYIIDTWIQSFGDYLTRLPFLSFQTQPNKPADAWQGWWTIFYLGTWLAMAPLLGAFLAAISRGRTVRALLVGGFAAPALATTVIVSAMGGTALHIELFGDDGLIEPLKQDPALAVFEMLRTLAPADGEPGLVGGLPSLAAVVQIAALLTAGSAILYALHHLFQPAVQEVAPDGHLERLTWRRQLRRGALLYAVIAIVLGGAAAAVWAYLGLAGWSVMRTLLFLAAVPAAVYLIAAVIALLRPVGAPAAGAPDAD